MPEEQEISTFALEPEEVVDFLVSYYFSRPDAPVFLVGRHGIGKSRSVYDATRKIAKMMGREFIDYDDTVADKILENPDKYFVFVDFRLTETEPADLIGIPRPENGHVVYKPLKWAVVLSKVPGILFLDELNMIQRPDVEAVSFKILNDKKVGFTKLLDSEEAWVLIVAAGNEPKENPLAKYLTAPAMGRIMKVDVKTPSVDSWIKWMSATYGEDWDRVVGAFLKKYSQFFVQSPDSSRTLNVYPEPRKWTKLALVSHKLNDWKLRVAARGLVGAEAAEHFMVFRSMKIPDEEVVLKNPEVFSSLNMDAQRLLIAQIAMNFDVKKLEKYKKFIDWLHDNDKEALLILMLMMSRDDLKTMLKYSLKNADWSHVLSFAVKTEKIAIEIESLSRW